MEPTIGQFAEDAVILSAEEFCPELDTTFSLHPNLTSVLVRLPGDEYSLFDRRDFTYHMTGPYGYGRMLLQRYTVGDLVEDGSSLVLPAETTIVEANNALFLRPYRYRHHDIVVTGVGEEGVGVLRVPVLLEQAAQIYAHQALHDRLTGLPNRALLIERLHTLFSQHRHAIPSCALLFIDLDRFKVVNDSLGHAAGDELLCSLGTRLTESPLRSMVTARLGGDEFAILLEQVHDREEAIACAEWVLDLLEVPLSAGERSIHVDASIGIALPEHGDDTSRLLRKADLAMYQAKRAGGNKFALFSGSLEKLTDSRLELETDLRGAIDRGEIEVFYQPIVNLDDRGLLGFEALVRWRHPLRGLVAPADFLPVAEETGLVTDLDTYVLREACRQAACWRATMPAAELLVMSVNLSAKQLVRPDLVALVRQALQETGLPAEYLQVEITESNLIPQPALAAAALNGLRALGVRVAIDDFGTGYSSLNHLRQFPVDVLKIDRAFVQGASANREDEAIVRIVVALAEATGMDVIAEGIEEESQADFLRSARCHRGQGYLYARPVATQEATGLIEAAARSVDSRAA